jgi:hypothetical protein
MGEKLQNYKVESVEEILNPVGIRLEINDRPKKECGKIIFWLNGIEVPFYQKDDLLYLPAEYIALEKIKLINEDFIGKFPKDITNDDISKIKIRKDGVKEERIEDMVTLAYILYLNDKVAFDIDNTGAVYVLNKDFYKNRLLGAKTKTESTLFYNYYNQDLKRREY